MPSEAEMLLTNGFAIFRGEGAPSLAASATERVKRYAEHVLVDSGDGFEEFQAKNLSGKRSVALAFSLERGTRGTFPLVHGFVEGLQDEARSLPEGEYSLVGKAKNGLFAARDPLGTRGLWTVPEGAEGGAGGAGGSLASDSRLLPDGRSRLLPTGRVYENGKTRRAGRRVETCPSPASFEDAAKELASLVDESVRKRVRGHKRVAVSFSGGLDSSVIAMVASRYAEVVLCSAYAAGSRDERQTARAAGLLDLRLEHAVMDEETVIERSRAIDLAFDDATQMDAALWAIYSAASRLASLNKARVIFLGQLADELFGGYKKYAVAANADGPLAAERMMRRDVRACADKGFIRDEAACSAWAEARFPFADARIASFAAGTPTDYKIRGEERKAVLRAAALELGLPEELANAPKKAAQFSSGVAKLLSRQY